MKEREIFIEALQCKDAAELVTLLNERCGGDKLLRDSVEELLANHDGGSFFLDQPPPGLDVEQTPSEIGPYKIREKIGEGGMGVVYVAEQTEPVQRKVAIKVIKPGMDTKEVIARFEAERQALAFMEHPNIARVLDAGATESGRSYFVMELVRGIPITEYCDQVKATPRERLDLFQTVCDAVQHAHQKGIIHRDIKPSNVLVTQVGAKPVVKVIDFGLAKVTSGQKLTDKTVYTGFMKLMGTPAYMSPEQAGLSGLDVDTRSDVYSLGVLLYELLTGTTPLDKTEIQKQAYEELCRQIREVEAPKPSARVSTLKDADRSTISQQRGIEPQSLRQVLNGDLDIVVLRALEKDRDRRYGSPQELATDIDRFLNDQPVLAVPPSPMYLARKYMRRYKAAILMAATILALLIVTTAVSTWLAIRATNAEQKAEDRLVAVALARREAEDEANERQRLLYAADMAMAAQLWESENGDLREIEALLTAWIPNSELREDWRDFSWRYQWTRLHKSAVVTARDTIGATISSEGHLLTATPDGLYRWDETGARSRLVWGRDIDAIEFSANGSWAVLTFEEQNELIDVATGRTVLTIPHSLFTFSTRGEYLAAWEAGDETVRVWSLSGITSTGQKKSSTVDAISTSETLDIAALADFAHARMPKSGAHLRLFDDGQSFLLKSTYAVAAFWPGQGSQTKWSHRSMVWNHAWSPNGQLMVSANYNGRTHLRLRTDPANKTVIGTHGKPITALAFSVDGTRLAIGGGDGTIDIWDVSELDEVSERTRDELETELTQRRSIESSNHEITALNWQDLRNCCERSKHTWLAKLNPSCFQATVPNSPLLPAALRSCGTWTTKKGNTKLLTSAKI